MTRALGFLLALLAGGAANAQAPGAPVGFWAAEPFPQGRRSLPLSGGTLTGDLTVGGGDFSVTLAGGGEFAINTLGSSGSQALRCQHTVPSTGSCALTTGPASTTTGGLLVATLGVFANTGGSGITLNNTTGVVYGSSSFYALTAGTFAGATSGFVRGAWFRLAWTNAMLAACGAGATCDITIGTLQARIMVKRALIEVTGQATHASTLTMSLGTAAGGTQYVLASDLKAAAGTLYGDAVAETGASLKDSGNTAWVDHIPAFGTTQALNVRLTAGAGNVNSVTGSTGAVLLLLELIP